MSNALNDDEFFKELDMRLSMAQVASCTCIMKSPDARHHGKACRYRALVEAQQALRKFRDWYLASMNKKPMTKWRQFWHRVWVIPQF